MAPHNGPAFGHCPYTQITGSSLGAGPITAPCRSSLLLVQMNNAALLQPPSLSEGSRTEVKLAEFARLQGTWIPGPEMFGQGLLAGVLALSPLPAYWKHSHQLCTMLEKYETPIQTFSWATLTTSVCSSSKNYSVRQSQCLSNTLFLLPSQEAYHSQTGSVAALMFRTPQAQLKIFREQFSLMQLYLCG